MRRITIWVFDGYLTSAVSGALDVFTVANSIWVNQHRGSAGPLFAWRLESPDGKAVKSCSGLSLEVDGMIGVEPVTDALWLPGAYFGRGVPFFLQALDRFRALYPQLRQTHEQGSLIAANCSSVFLLAEARLLDGKSATTSWLLARAFRERYPAIDLQSEQLMVENDRVICSGATTSYLNLALHLVEKFAGPDLAAICAKIFLVDINRTLQAPYTTLTLQDYLQHNDRLVLGAQEWIREQIHQPFSLQRLAQFLKVSERTVIRRFKAVLTMTPTDYCQLMKIDTAKRLLETSSLALDQVCERVGYGDISSFRRLFKRETGVSPSDYRLQFARRQYRSARTNLVTSVKTAAA